MWYRNAVWPYCAATCVVCNITVDWLRNHKELYWFLIVVQLELLGPNHNYIKSSTNNEEPSILRSEPEVVVPQGLEVKFWQKLLHQPPSFQNFPCMNYTDMNLALFTYQPIGHLNSVLNAIQIMGKYVHLNYPRKIEVIKFSRVIRLHPFLICVPLNKLHLFLY